MMKIFDTHAHYDDVQYDEDREEILKRIYEKGVDRVMLVSANLSNSVAEKQIYEKYNEKKGFPTLYYSVGDHPDEVLRESVSSVDGVVHLETLEKLCKNDNESIVASAIGEIGLDYYGDTKDEIAKKYQKEWFIAELTFAKKLNLPVIVHSRDACKDTYDIIKEYAKGMKGIIHCFSYEKEIAEEYIKLGFYIGIGGVVTFKNARKLKEVVERISLDYILTETDCPYLAPVPYRGKRNDSSFISYVIEEIANIKNMDKELVSEILYNNAVQFFTK